MTYDEYMKVLNDEAMFKGLRNMTEVETLDIAHETGKHLVKLINESSNLTKKDIKKAKYAIAEVTFQKTKYIAALYRLNGADVLLRATDPITKKHYIPNEVWIPSTNAETNETHLELIMSIGERVEE